MKESKLNEILNITATTLAVVSALAFAGYIADSTCFHRLDLDFFPTGYVSMFGTLIWGITAGALHEADKINRRTGLTFEQLNMRYQESLKYLDKINFRN